jgi:hypothetical protein
LTQKRGPVTSERVVAARRLRAYASLESRSAPSHPGPTTPSGQGKPKISRTAERPIQAIRPVRRALSQRTLAGAHLPVGTGYKRACWLVVASSSTTDRARCGDRCNLAQNG